MTPKSVSSQQAIRAVVFDAYGTLFNPNSAQTQCEAFFPGHGTKLAHLWRKKQLEYSWLTSLMGRYRDFAVLTREALTFACEQLNLPLGGERADSLMFAYEKLQVFPEVREMLAKLGHLKLAILSNGSPVMLSMLVRNSQLQFDHAFSIDEVQVYKPHPRVYQLAAERLALPPEAIAFVTANGWDAAGARSFGFRVFWINRTGQPRERLDAPPHVILKDLSELPAHLGVR